MPKYKNNYSKAFINHIIIISIDISVIISLTYIIDLLVNVSKRIYFKFNRCYYKYNEAIAMPILYGLELLSLTHVQLVQSAT